MSLIKLFDREFEEIYELAKKTALSYSGEWDNFQDSDPGVTMIEVFAMLKDLQQFYMEQINEKSIKQLLRLFQIKSGKGSSSKYAGAEVYGKENTSLIGDSLNYRDDTFIINEVCPNTQNRIIGISSKTEISTIDYNYPIDEGREVYPFGLSANEGSEFIIELQKKVIVDNMKILIKVNDYGRNPFKDFSEDKMGQIICKYIVYKDNEVVWDSDIEIKNDYSFAFLESGIIELKGFRNHIDCEGDCRFYVSFKLIKSEYERIPRIAGIYLNPVLFEQGYRAICRQYINLNDLSICKYELSHKVKDTRGIRVFLKNGDIYTEIKEFEIIQEGIKSILAIESIKDSNAEKLLMVTRNKNYIKESLTYSGNMHSNQTINLGMEDIDYDDFEIMVNEKSGWKLWTKTDELALWGPKDRVYEFDNKSGIIKFGDGIKGRVLPNGKDNIMVISLKFTKFSQGTYMGFEENLKGTLEIDKNSILLLEEGQSIKNLDLLYREFKNEVLKSDVLATKSDYIERIKLLPGLLIEEVKVLEESNSIKIKVKVAGEKESSTWKNYYRRRIENFIHNYKQVTRKVELELY